MLVRSTLCLGHWSLRHLRAQRARYGPTKRTYRAYPRLGADRSDNGTRGKLSDTSNFNGSPYRQGTSIPIIMAPCPTCRDGNVADLKHKNVTHAQLLLSESFGCDLCSILRRISSITHQEAQWMTDDDSILIHVYHSSDSDLAHISLSRPNERCLAEHSEEDGEIYVPFEKGAQMAFHLDAVLG
jgi:hypothetical protein